MSAVAEGYRYRVDWTTPRVPGWETIFSLGVPRDKVLEIGTFEGRSACWFLEHFLSPTGSLYCVDTWEGGFELRPDMTGPAEEMFQNNIAIATGPGQHVAVLKKKSIEALTDLLANGHAGTFDLIYVDGCHQAPEVLADAVLSFHLLRQGGILLFDDYTMDLQKPIDQRPKFAIDSFLTAFNDKVRTIMCRDQYAVRKTKP